MNTQISRGVTVTIKYGRGYESPWAVFHGQPDEVRADLTAFFGLSAEAVAGLTLSDIVVNATTQAHAVATIATGLGGATVIESRPDPSTKPVTDTASTADPWTQASAPQPAQPSKPAENPLLARIARASDVPSLQRIWADDPTAFTDPAVMQAWKARGRVLTQTT